MPVIAGPCSSAYFAPMLAALLRLLTAAALALMPFGMAAASVSPAQHAPAASSAHCDKQGSKPSEETPADGLAGCTAGCSMFIAEISAARGPVQAMAQIADGPREERWTNLPAETATPPPKLA
jgi:hypothetical protein